jgi:hypothetical protein
MSYLNFDFIFAGNYITTLVGALEIAKTGKKVCVVNPVPTWGGHFSKINVNGLNFDPGAVSHEFTTFNDEGIKDPLTYNPARRNDVGRFIKLVEAYTQSHIEVVKMHTPCTVYDQKLYPDLIMINRFEVLQHPGLKERIKGELSTHALSHQHEWHPIHKKTSNQFYEHNYYEISVATHGATLHSELFEPFFFKMSNLSSTRLLALYHRIAWLPLYYPETILSQFGNNPQVLNETYYCYPKAGHIGVFAETLVQKLEAAGVTILRDGITSVADTPGKTTIHLKNNTQLTAPKVIWSLAHDQLITSATGKEPNQFERWSATLAFITIPTKEIIKPFSVLYSPDDKILFYRASNLTNSSQSDEENSRFVVEYNPDYLKGFEITTDEAIAERVRTDFMLLGIITDPAHIQVAGIKTLKNVLLLPSKENKHLLENERDILYEHYPNILFTRNTDAFFTDTLNDQIIKGLKIAAQFSNATWGN